MEGKRHYSAVEGSTSKLDVDHRSKRDGKPAKERGPSDNLHGARNVTDEDSRRRLHDPLPLESSSKARETETGTEHDPPRRNLDLKSQSSSKSTHGYNAGSYFQRDERAAMQSSRETRRRQYSGFRDKDDNSRIHSYENKRQYPAKEESDKVWRHDRFHELETTEPREKRRRVFRETKDVPQDASTEGKVTIIDDKSDGLNKIQGKDVNERPHESRKWAEEQKRDTPTPIPTQRGGRWLERNPKFDRFPYPPGRFHSSRRGRDRLVGRRDTMDRPTFQARTATTNTVAEKWKHDMFEEANRSPTPKSDEAQIAKIEALLSS